MLMKPQPKEKKFSPLVLIAFVIILFISSLAWSNHPVPQKQAEPTPQVEVEPSPTLSPAEMPVVSTDNIILWGVLLLVVVVGGTLAAFRQPAPAGRKTNGAKKR